MVLIHAAEHNVWMIPWEIDNPDKMLNSSLLTLGFSEVIKSVT